MKIAIIYGSEGGATEGVAEKIKDMLMPMGEVSLSKVSDGFGPVQDANLVVLGSSTWGIGEMQEDWVGQEDLSGVDLQGKHVAVFGTGDQEGYSDTFVDAIGILAESARKAGATLVGTWPVEGYEFTGSAAVNDGVFVGLAIDEDNQADMTDDRIEQWTARIRQEFSS